ncbi:hypothetical protein OAE55_00570 [Gammaproteobacteria bacterium]|nr:hypothetical protein [Gammaproteobacteria bacterium]
MISLSSQGVYFVRFLFLFFIAVPLVEMLLLFEVSDQIGGAVYAWFSGGNGCDRGTGP